MTPPARTQAATWWPIATVERETGISKDTLRVWERRYGFPTPERDAIGDRRYSAEQVARLQQLKRLIDAGYRPGQVVPEGPQQLARLEAQRGALSRPPPAAPVAELLALVKTHDIGALRAAMRQTLAQRGARHFVVELAAPLTMVVGEAWARGEVEVFEEHLFTECLEGVLREAIADLQRLVGTRGPRVLLATGPGEMHTLGLQMVETLLALEGAACVSMGAHAPLKQIALAARAQRTEILCLSFSAAANPHLVASTLADLRGGLDAAIEIWAGGAGLASLRRPPPGVRLFDSLRSIPDALSRRSTTETMAD